jgi:hypothetical protein
MEMCAWVLVALDDFKDGNTSIQDQPRSSSPRATSTAPNKKRVDEIINEDRRVTLDTIATNLE